MIKLLIGKYAGFCPGVENAVKLASRAATENPSVFCLGEISHNERVIDELKKKGLVFVNDVEDIPDGAVVIIRSHGEGEQTFKRLAEKNASILDATCPFVKKIHELVHKYYALDYKIVIVGERGHPEVSGICGWCRDAIILNDYSVSESIFSKMHANKSEDGKTITNTCTRDNFSDDAAISVDEINAASTDIFEDNSTTFSKDIKSFISTDSADIISEYSEYFVDKLEGSVNEKEDMPKMRNRDWDALKNAEKICVVCQTTFPTQKFAKIIKKIEKLHLKTVEIFDTICYTTFARQKETVEIAQKSDLVLVVGSEKSANTRKLVEIATAHCKTHLVTCADALKKIWFMPGTTVGLLAGASTPKESVMEVIDYMNQNVGEVTVSEELKAGVEESLMSYREGKRVNGTVISADDKGIRVNIGGKYDGIIYAAESGIDQEYNPADYQAGAEIEAMIIGKKDSDTDCILLSKRKIDLIKEGDKVIESIRGGEVFELLAASVTKGGLLGKLGTYTVFIPSSQIKEKGFPKDLNAFVKKKLRLTVLDIDDNKHKIVASQKKILERERAEREEIFWTHVKPNVIVNGTVKRITNFGAFVSVDGFDCLAHIVDLSWNHIKNVEEVLNKDEAYDFIVLSADKEKGRVSLGYKQLQPHPYTVAFQKHPIGSVCKGKIVSIVPFGAFVQIEPGIEGLVHVSEAAHSYVKNINEVVKVGEEVDVMILDADEASRRITLSIKACLPEEAPVEGASEDEKKVSRNDRGGRKPSGGEKTSWNESNSNNPFADLLKDVELDKGNKQK